MTNSSDAPPEPQAATGAKSFAWSRLLPLVVVIAGFIAFFALGLDDYASFEVLRANRDYLSTRVEQSYVLSVLVYVLVYVLVVAFSLPISAIMSMVGGFLFGWIAATFYILIAATTGASIIFLIAKTALGDYLRARATGVLKTVEDGFRKNAFNYLLFLRLVPVFPFAAINLATAFLGVSLRTFVVATFIGIIPGAAVYAGIGSGLDSAFESGGTPDFAIIFKPSIFVPITALALLSLIPVAYKKLSKTRQAG